MVVVNVSTTITSEQDRLPYWSHVLGLFLYICLFLLAIFGNALALWILRTKSELRTLAHAFLTNLVIADLLLALLTPFEAVATFSAAYVFGDYGCKIQRTSLYFFYAATILTLSAISLERYIAICCPLRYDYDKFKNHKTRIILLVWLTSALIVIPHLYLSEERIVNGEAVCFQFHTTNETRLPFFWGYSVPCFLLLYFLPLVLVSITYWKAAKTLSELEDRLEVTSTVDMSMTVRMKQEMLRMLLVVIIFFVIQWTPFEIVEMLDSSPGVMEDVNPISSHRVAVNMLAFSNAVVNPILFGFMSKPFREGFKEGGWKIIKCLCCTAVIAHCSSHCSCWDVVSRRSFTCRCDRRNNSTTDITSSAPTTSSVEVDWASTFSKISNPVSIVESGLDNYIEENDMRDSAGTGDHKL